MPLRLRNQLACVLLSAVDMLHAGATRTRTALPLVSCAVAKLLLAVEVAADGHADGCVCEVQQVSVVAFAREAV
jgi:hypothetical protein